MHLQPAVNKVAPDPDGEGVPVVAPKKLGVVARMKQRAADAKEKVSLFGSFT